MPTRDGGEGHQEREVLQTAVAETDQEHGEQERADADTAGARDGPRHERHPHSRERDQGHEETSRAVAVRERTDTPSAERSREPHQEQAPAATVGLSTICGVNVMTAPPAKVTASNSSIGGSNRR